jgi:hypothetical protein
MEHSDGSEEARNSVPVPHGLSLAVIATQSQLGIAVTFLQLRLDRA